MVPSTPTRYQQANNEIRVEKHDGIWAIAHRAVVYDWSRVQKVPDEYPSEHFEIGKRSKRDLSYQRF